MTNKTGLYKITNKVNGKAYYGSAKNMSWRRNTHLSQLRRGVHHNDHLQRAYNKHGEEAFKFSVFAYCDLENLVEYEQILLDLHVGDKDCYNLAPSATSSFLGRKHTEETKRKQSEAAMGRRLGAKASDETKLKQSEAQKGRKHSEETKAKMSATHKGKPKPKLTCPHCGKEGGTGNMSRWHFDNCKHNPSKQ